MLAAFADSNVFLLPREIFSAFAPPLFFMLEYMIEKEAAAPHRSHIL